MTFKIFPYKMLDVGTIHNRYLQTSPDKLLLRHIAVIIDVKRGEDGHGSVNSRLLLQTLVEIEGPEELHHLPQLDCLGLVLVVHLEDPVEFIRRTAGGGTVGGDDELIEVNPTILVLAEIQRFY